MPTPKTNRFQAFELTEQELRSAHVLNELQKANIQTLLSVVAEELINTEAATAKEFQEQEVQRAYKKGQMAAFQYLLDLSSSMEITIAEDNAAVQEAAQYKLDPVSPNLYSRGE